MTDNIEIQEELNQDYSRAINPDLALKFKSGEELNDSDIDFIADLSVSVLRDLLSFYDAEDSPIDELSLIHI